MQQGKEEKKKEASWKKQGMDESEYGESVTSC